MTKTMTLTDIFTEDELQKIGEMYDSTPDHLFAKKVAAEIVTPILPRIEAKLGQEMDAGYIAYACSYVFGEQRKARAEVDRTEPSGPKL